jgi:hypothetical protein
VGNTFLQLKLVLNKGNKIEHVPIGELLFDNATLITVIRFFFFSMWQLLQSVWWVYNVRDACVCIRCLVPLFPRPYCGLELTLPQFYQFLHEMEKAKQNLEYFS